jgi:hypothetical protein
MAASPWSAWIQGRFIGLLEVKKAPSGAFFCMKGVDETIRRGRFLIAARPVCI